MRLNRDQPLLTNLASIMVIVGGIIGIGWILLWAMNAELEPVRTSLSAMDERLTSLEERHGVRPAQPLKPLSTH